MAVSLPPCSGNATSRPHCHLEARGTYNWLHKCNYDATLFRRPIDRYLCVYMYKYIRINLLFCLMFGLHALRGNAVGASTPRVNMLAQRTNILYGPVKVPQIRILYPGFGGTCGQFAGSGVV